MVVHLTVALLSVLVDFSALFLNGFDSSVLSLGLIRDGGSRRMDDGVRAIRLSVLIFQMSEHSRFLIAVASHGTAANMQRMTAGQLQSIIQRAGQ